MAPLTAQLAQLDLFDRNFAIVAAIVAFALYSAWSSSKRNHLPRGPRPWPIVGNRLQMPREKPWLQLEKWAKEYGPVYTIWTSSKPTLVVSSAKISVELLDKRSDRYSDRPRSIVAGELMGLDQHILFSLYGPRWRTMRKIYHLALMAKAADNYKPLQEMESRRLAQDFLLRPDDFERHIERYTASIVVGIAYGRRVDDPNVGFVSEIVKRMQNLERTNMPGKQMLDAFPFLQDLPEWMTPYKRKWKAWREEDQAFYAGLGEHVKSRMAEGKAGPSFLRTAIETKDQFPLADDVLILRLAGGIFGAGVGTTFATLMAFVLAMTCFPDVQAKAQAELDRVVGRDRTPTFEDEDDLPYIGALLKETLRWRPVAVLGGTPHAAQVDDVWNGYNIPKGTAVVCNTWAIHRDPEYFPDPDRFMPERFLKEKKGEFPAYPQLNQHSAFGWGRRICPGAHVAHRTLFIGMATLLHHFNFSKAIDPTTGKEITPDIFAFSDGFNSRALPFKTKIEPRLGPSGVARIEREQKEAFEGLQAYE